MRHYSEGINPYLKRRVTQRPSQSLPLTEAEFCTYNVTLHNWSMMVPASVIVPEDLIP